MKHQKYTSQVENDPQLTFRTFCIKVPVNGAKNDKFLFELPCDQTQRGRETQNSTL